MNVETPIDLDRIRNDPARVLFTSRGASLLDLDDGVVCLEFHSKGNTLDGDTIEAAEAAFAIVPRGYLALIVANQGRNFSYGANLEWLLQQLETYRDDREGFLTAAKRFQRLTTGMRTQPFPTVSAPFGLTVGGALELSLYCTRICALADLRATLPEVAVGILPDLGGTSEVYRRWIAESDTANELRALEGAFDTIVSMRSSSDARAARRYHFLGDGDSIVETREELVATAKATALALVNGFQPSPHFGAIRVTGDEGYARLERRIDAAVASGMASAYDAEIARAIARVMTGHGARGTMSHQEMLDLETQAFASLVFRPETQARMQHMLRHGAPLRN